MKSEKEILLERAKKTAVRKDIENQLTGETTSVVEFLLASERYAFDEEYVSEVFSLKDITVIPGAPLFVMGVINLRGRIVSIINLKILFNLRESGLTELNKVILLKNEKMEFGIVADSILGNTVLLHNTLSPAPLTIDNIAAEYISGVTPEGLILLNAAQLLASKQIIVNK